MDKVAQKFKRNKKQPVDSDITRCKHITDKRKQWACAIKKQRNSLNRACNQMAKNKMYVAESMKSIFAQAPGCLVRDTRRVCNCRKRCVKRMIPKKDFFDSKCQFFGKVDVYSDSYSNCSYFDEISRTYDKTMPNLQLSKYDSFEGIEFTKGGFEMCLAYYINGMISHNEFACYVESMRDTCTAINDCYYLTVVINQIKGSQGKQRKALQLIKRIMNPMSTRTNKKNKHIKHKRDTNDNTLPTSEDVYTGIHYDSYNALPALHEVDMNNHLVSSQAQLLTEQSGLTSRGHILAPNQLLFATVFMMTFFFLISAIISFTSKAYICRNILSERRRYKEMTLVLFLILLSMFGYFVIRYN